ncbi:MAG TPA: peptidoglycan-binding domain-containing protein [Terriglobales bacterium]|nr:peptidoglycan-binding domain-containing protein [Terriglobales bacterium]
MAGTTGRLLIVACALLLAATLASADTSKSSPKHSATNSKSATKSHSHSRKGKRSRKASWKRGQQKPDTQRAREIQEALIREHYLQGEATGVWDQKSQKAMERYQTDNGWQSKTIPDSRALIKLGLGPNHDHLLNPESAMTTPIAAPKSTTPSNVTADPARTSSQPQK